MLGECHNDPVSEWRDRGKANFLGIACAPSGMAGQRVRKALQYACSIRMFNAMNTCRERLS